MLRKISAIVITIITAFSLLVGCSGAKSDKAAQSTGKSTDKSATQSATQSTTQSSETTDDQKDGGDTIAYASNLEVKNGSYDTVYGALKTTSEKTFALFDNSAATIKAKVTTANGTDGGGLVVGASGESGGFYGEPDASYYYFHRYGERKIRFSKVSGGKTYLLSTSYLAGTRARREAELKVVVDGNNVKGYVNDVCYLNYTAEKPLEGGKVGLRADNSGVIYDEIQTSEEKEVVTADIVVFGHSHTENWTRVEEDLKSVGKVVNAGIGGTIVPQWMSRVGDITAYGAKKFIVWLGSNDVGAGVANDVTVDRLNVLFKEIASSVPDAEIYLLTEFYQPSAGRATEAFHAKIRDLNERYKTAFKNVNVVDVFDVSLKSDGTLDASLFKDDYHLKPDCYGEVASRVLEAMKNPVKTSGETGAERGAFIIGEGDNSSWTISGSGANLKLVSNGRQNLITFGDREFNGGTVEFKMKVADGNFNSYCVSGAVFGASDYYVGNATGSFYCVGQSAWGDLVGISNILSERDWEHENKIPQGNLAVGKEYKIKIVWDRENNAIHYFLNDVYRMSTRAATALYGNKIGFYADNANVTFSDIRMTDELELTGVDAFYSRGLNGDWTIENSGAKASYTTSGGKILTFNKDFGKSDKWRVEFDIVNNDKTYVDMMATGIIIGADSPVVDRRDTYVVVGSSSYGGEFNAYSFENGRHRWEDSDKVLSFSPSLNQTYHYCFTWDKQAGTLTYYSNGRVIATQKLSVKLYGDYFGIATDCGATVKNVSITPM